MSNLSPPHWSHLLFCPPPLGIWAVATANQRLVFFQHTWILPSHLSPAIGWCPLLGLMSECLHTLPTNSQGHESPQLRFCWFAIFPFGNHYSRRSHHASARLWYYGSGGLRQCRAVFMTMALWSRHEPRSASRSLNNQAMRCTGSPPQPAQYPNMQPSLQNPLRLWYEAFKITVDLSGVTGSPQHFYYRGTHQYSASLKCSIIFFLFCVLQAKIWIDCWIWNKLSFKHAI